MNPLTNMKNVKKLSEQELYTGNKTSWHDQYRSSAWIFVGGLPYDLTEGDIVCIFSQYGEIVNINLIRDKDTGKSKGFCFICYEDQRSTDLSVDNFNGIKILNRIIRVDHVNDYKIPKQGKKTDEETKKLYEEGCAPKPVSLAAPIKGPVKIKKDPDDFRETLADQINSEIKLPARLPIYTVKQEKVDEEESSEVVVKKEKKEKKHKKDKKKKKKKRKSDGSGDSDSDKSKKKKQKRKRDKDESDSNYSAEDSVSEDEEKEEKRKRSRSPHDRKKR